MEREPKTKRRAARPSPQAGAFVKILRTADALTRGAEAVVNPYDLSGTQYNVLRILRGAGPEGLACREVGCRMISRDPDITRLLDRLEARGFIARARQSQDRRVVKTRITEGGLALLAKLDQPIRDLHTRQFRRFSRKQIGDLLHLLDRAMDPEEPPRSTD